ncbi:MAG TPA: NAD(P)-dependent oxidoreductase [Dehalococcoidales bacterium]|nr:NAD(P)-dependent oxidoreductase [Dehalococcoidales bacterium]
MKVAIIGASGNIGSAIRDEALSRGHQVTAVVRHPEKITIKNPALTVMQGDVLKDPVDRMVRGHDAVISAYNPGWSNPNIAPETTQAYTAIIAGVKKADVKRLLVVGGAGSLEASPGVQLIDTMKVPDLIRGAILALREVLYTLRKEKDLDWTFLSPAATIAPGQRTGKFRLGKDQVVKDANGDSKISIQDYAVAMIDELEKPKHSRQRFTIGY